MTKITNPLTTLAFFLHLDWQTTDPRVKMEIFAIENSQCVVYSCSLNEISFDK